MAKQDVAIVAAGVGVWSAKGDPTISGRVGQLLAQPGGLSLLNAATWRSAAMAVTWREGVNGLYGAGSVPLPDDFPPLEIALPTGNWSAPDYFDLGIFKFVSARLRSALALPPTAAQYLELKTLEAGTQSLARNYQMLRVLQHTPAMDTERSVYWAPEIEIPGHGLIRPIVSASSFVVRTDLIPPAELFWSDEPATVLLAVDALAERVMQAGCTGIRFQDPTTQGVLNGVIRYRTATGVAEETLG